MRDREKNLGVHIGDSIIHKSCEFVIVEMRCDESMDGTELLIRAYNPDRAAVEQQKKIKVDQTAGNLLDMLRKLSEGGGEGLMGKFSIGG